MTDKDYLDLIEISLRRRDVDMELMNKDVPRCAKELAWLRIMGLMETWDIL